MLFEPSKKQMGTVMERKWSREPQAIVCLGVDGSEGCPFLFGRGDVLWPDRAPDGRGRHTITAAWKDSSETIKRSSLTFKPVPIDVVENRVFVGAARLGRQAPSGENQQNW